MKHTPLAQRQSIIPNQDEGQGFKSPMAFQDGGAPDKPKTKERRSSLRLSDIEKLAEKMTGDVILDKAVVELHSRLSSMESLIAFTQRTMPSYQPTWFHKVLAEQLELIAMDRLQRLMIFEPPRHGKSELASVRFPAWYLGKHKQRAVIGTSYAIELARSFSSACRNVVLNQLYQSIWPYKLSKDADTHWQLAGKEDERSSYIAAGVGGGITGEGANLLLVDDPFKNYAEALSQVTRNTVWNWFTSTARTRLAPGGAIVIIMTRWHEDDLAGRLIRLAQEDARADQWRILELPASNDGEFSARLWATDRSINQVFEPYEALWSERYDKYFLRATRATMGTMQYSALFGGSPKTVEGNIIKRHWFRNWYVMPGDPVPHDATGMRPGYAFERCEVLPEKFDEEAQSWDMAFKDQATNDFVAGGAWGKIGATKYLLERICERLDYPATKNAVRRLTSKRPNAHRKWVEDKANGPAIIADLRTEIPGLIAVEPLGSKEARLSAASPDAEAGNVILPHPSIAPWVYDFIECLCAFPNGLHDDDCDMFSQAIIKLRTTGEGLIGLWRQQAEARKTEITVQEARPDNWAIQSQAEKDAVFNRMQTPKTLGKVKTNPQTPACPQCGNKVLARYSEGKWVCNGCGTKGQDKVNAA